MSLELTNYVLSRQLQQLRLALGYKAYTDLGLTYHQIAGLDDILISGKAVKNVVGFDSDSVFTLADAKKNPVEGSTDLKKKMVVTSGDVCASFAANVSIRCSKELFVSTIFSLVYLMG